MACNCKADKQILELAKRYGTQKKSRKAYLKGGLTTLGYSIIGLLTTIIVVIPMFLYVLYKALFSKNKVISLKRTTS